MRVFGITLSLFLAAAPIFADSVIANQTAPYSLVGIITTSYTVAFTGDGGVVSGTTGTYAAPWDYTSNGPWSGDYLTTGVGSVTIGFATPQTELTLLWGSIDGYNTIKFDNGVQYDGTQIASLVNINPAQGAQNQVGSAYVEFYAPGSFKTVTFSSTQYGFEFAGVQASVPDGGMTLMLLGGALFGLGALRRKFRA